MGSVSPNPAVGAVIVKNSKIISYGYHRKAGGPHAEVEALERAGIAANGADLYVTLEPCNHHGKTPPCSEAIIKAGIKKVIISVLDPNPTVKGGGKEFLENAGVEVVTGVLESQGQELISSFLHYIKFGRPYLTLKLALTLDGKITSGLEGQRWLSSKTSQAFVQRLRSRSDAVLVGKNTVIKDNPFLTNRLKMAASRSGFFWILNYLSREISILETIRQKQFVLRLFKIEIPIYFKL